MQCVEGVFVATPEITSSYTYLACDFRFILPDNVVNKVVCVHRSFVSMDVVPMVPPFAYMAIVYVSIYVLVLLVMLGRYVKVIDYSHNNVIKMNFINDRTVFGALELVSSNSDVYVTT
jgi:hypothetical protein